MLMNSPLFPPFSALLPADQDDDGYEEDSYQILNYDDIDFSGIDHDVLADLEVRAQCGSYPASSSVVTRRVCALFEVFLVPSYPT